MHIIWATRRWLRSQDCSVQKVETNYAPMSIHNHGQKQWKWWGLHLSKALHSKSGHNELSKMVQLWSNCILLNWK